MSGRTDVCAFYSEWFFNRLRAGWFDVRNPFNPKMVSRIYLDNVDAFLFCTKNPLPMIDRLNEIKKPMLFHVTVTGYHEDIEPGVIYKKKLWEGLKTISDKIGKDNLYIRYDPILINERYTVDYHVRAFEQLARKAAPIAGHIVISFLDDCKNVRNNVRKVSMRRPSAEEQEALGKAFSEIAKKYGLDVFACNERNMMEKYGFSSKACFSQTKAFLLTGKALGKWKARDCGCVEMADIGEYCSCPHFCKYCYANFDESLVAEKMRAHDPNSSLLTGYLSSDDVIKVRTK